MTRAARARARVTFVEVEVQVPCVDAARDRASRRPRWSMLSYPSYSVVRELVAPASPGRARRAGTRGPGKSGGADRNRTDDIQLAKLALYQLSYSPKCWSRTVVGLGGFEPPTSRLSGVRSEPTEL
jgi:hypothetical protein